MLNAKMQDALNKQINAELFSSYLYLSMAAYSESQSFPGMASWMRAQAQEELGHALKLYDFLNERDGRVLLTAVEAPRTEWSSPLEVFEEAYKHELKVTGLINSLVKLSMDEADYAAHSFLQWFINEQVEEESTVVLIINKLKLVGDNGVALFMLDHELGQRSGGSGGQAVAAK
jgi:ferritin